MGLWDMLFGKHEPPYKNENPCEELEYLLKVNRKIEAIKRVREITQWGLKEAKDFVDYFESVRFSWDLMEEKFGAVVKNKFYRCPEQSKKSSDFIETLNGWENLPMEYREGFTQKKRMEIEELLRKNNKIGAIKVARTVIPDMGLKEAKDFIENLERDLNL